MLGNCRNCGERGGDYECVCGGSGVSSGCDKGDGKSGVLDGKSLNSALLSSSKADVAYYLGWTYIDKTTPATEEDFAEFTANTQNPNASKEQKVLYGIGVKRTELRAFPTEKPIGDDPSDKKFDYQYLSSIRVNEPLVITSVSADGKYYLAKNICCSGWVSAEV